MSPRPPARGRGFTLPELVMMIVVVGILAVVMAPRFISWRGFASRGFYDEAQAVVRYAQKTAIAWRRSIVVCVSATEVRAISNIDCNAPATLTHPTSGAPLKSTAPDGVTLSNTAGPSFSFDGLGRPSAPATITLTSTITDDPARQIVVESQTGYVHR
jgi:MSHA pilin protein MshC